MKSIDGRTGYMDHVPTYVKLAVILTVLLLAMPLVPAQIIGKDNIVSPDSDIGGINLEEKADLETAALTSRAGVYPALINNSDRNDAVRYNYQRKALRDDNGTLHTVHDHQNEVWYSQSYDDGQTWVNLTNISNTAQNAVAASIATNGTNIYIAWTQGQDMRFRRSLDGGATWDPTLANPGYRVYQGGGGNSATVPSIAAAGAYVYIAMTFNPSGGWWDNELVVWVNNNYGDSAAWTNSWILGDTGPNEYEPSIVANGNTVYIAYSADGGGDKEIYTIRSDNNGGTWGTIRQLTNNGANDQNPSIAVAANNFSVAWECDERGNWEVNYRNSTDNGANWDVLYNVSNTTSQSRYPSLVRSDTTTYLLYQDDEDHAGGDVFFRSFNNNVWSPSIDLTNSDQQNVYPNSLITITNQYVEYVYSRNAPDPNDVLFSRFYVGPNDAPSLGYTQEVGYASDGLDPEGDSTGHSYIYRVDYTDSDGDPPMQGYPEVWIDYNIDGDYNDPGEVISMTEVNAADTTYTDGKRYTFSTMFSDLGLYTYTFRAYDDKNYPATGLPTNDHTGPNITEYNVPPQLFWLESKDYEDDGLNPEEGMIGEDFVFKVKYWDILDDPPGVDFPKVMFDMDNNGLFNDTIDEEATMVEESAADTTYYNGKIFTYTRTFDAVGTYGYMFFTEDSIGLTNETESRVGPMVSVDTNPPLLMFTGETGFETDGVNPDTGSIYTIFEFRVNYSDADDENPLNDVVEIALDIDRNGTFEASEILAMDEVDTGDTTFDDGKIYTYSTTFPALGTYNYTFMAKDNKSAPAGGEAVVIKQVLVNIDNHLPELKWTGEANYTSAGLNPATGTANLTEFVYRVKYEDADDDPPASGYPVVGIDLDHSDTFEPVEFFAMNEVSPTDTDFTDGKLYTCSYIFNKMGDFKYTFSAKDSNNDLATGTPIGTFDGPSITDEYIEVFPPVLDWTGEAGYESDGVAPDTGTTLTEFVFKVKYSDQDNDLPASLNPVLWVDMDHDGLFNGSGDMNFAMSGEDANDTVVTDGKVYKVTLTFTTKGEYNYSFAAQSVRAGENTFVRGQLVGIFTVARGNTAPVLGWSGGSGYSTDGIEPDTGAPGDIFTYEVKYTDADNDPPANGYPKIMIDLNGDGAYDALTETFTMLAAEATDLVYTDGKVYRYAMPAGGAFTDEGTFKYKFSAMDNIGGVAVDLEGTGPVVGIPIPNELPELLFPTEAGFNYDGLDPMNGKKKTVFTFKIIYKDIDGDEPKGGFPQLWIDLDGNGQFTGSEEKVAMSADSTTDVTNGRAYKYTLTIDEPGTYSYSFYVENVVNQTASLGPFDGPVVVKVTDTGTTTTTGLGDMIWLLLVIIIAVVCAIIGFLAGKTRRREDEPPPETEQEYREGPVPTETPSESADEDGSPEENVPEEPSSEEPVLEDEPPQEERPAEEAPSPEESAPDTPPAEQEPPSEPTGEAPTDQKEGQ